MSNTPMTQSQKRSLESLNRLFSPDKGQTQLALFFTSSSDEGVIRNGGRNGARFAPKSFLSTFKKLALKKEFENYHFKVFEVADPNEEKLDFHQAQINQSHRIKNILNQHHKCRIYHLGGGHDHILPLLESLSDKFNKIVVINVDAHADTRTDDQFHSGTPFRQFAQSYCGDFHLYQIGLHGFANSESTLSPLGKGFQQILWKENFNIGQLDLFFNEIKKNTDSETAVIFSLDADALKSSEVPGVSAYNPDGLSFKDLKEIWERYKTLEKKNQPIIGIYELNPIYDNLASASMRSIAAFVYKTLE